MDAALRRVALAALLLGAVAFAADASGVWLNVPFVKQPKDGCGAASVAMVMQYWAGQQGRASGPAAEASRIQQALYSSKAHGIYASDLPKYFEQSGFRAFVFRGDWDQLRENLTKGRPLIVALKPSSGNVPLHYVVVAGLDGNDEFVLMNDPAQRKLLKEDRASFEKEWSATGKWTLLAVPRVDR